MSQQAKCERGHYRPLLWFAQYVPVGHTSLAKVLTLSLPLEPTGSAGLEVIFFSVWDLHCSPAMSRGRLDFVGVPASYCL